jgi:exonuclease SbcC
LKIKRVEIQAFKSYLTVEDGTFDFSIKNGEQPANFVSIYAPNGFGKTSFCDAVDYAITGKIGRYTRNSRIAKINEEESKQHNIQGQNQFVIRNKSAPTELETFVKVYSSNQELPYSKDYKPGNKGTSDWKRETKNKSGMKFFENAMLYQEAIDGFLREADPEERFVKFAENDENLFEIYQKRKTLGKVKQDLDKKRSELFSEKRQLQIDILELSLKESEFTQVNARIEKFNGVDSNTQLSPLKVPFGVEEYQNFLTEKTIADNLIQRELKHVGDEQQLIFRQIDKLPIYRDKNKQLVVVSTSLQAINETLAIRLQHDQLEVNKAATIRQVIDAEKQRLFLKEVDEELSSYTDIQKKLLDNKEQLKIIKSSLETTVCLIKLTQEEIEKLTLEADVNQQKTMEIDDKLISSESTFKKINLALRSQKSAVKELEKTNSQINFVKETVASLIAERKRFNKLIVEDLITKEVFSVLDLKSIEELNGLQDKCSQYRERYKELTQSVEQLKNTLQTTQEHTKKINELISGASDIIAKTQQSDCPLCQQPYVDFETLKKQIVSNPMLNVMEQDLTKQLQIVQRQQQQSQAYLAETLAMFKSKTMELDTRYSVEIQDNKTILNGFEVKVSNLNSTIEINQLSIKELTSQVLYRPETEYHEYIMGLKLPLIQANELCRQIISQKKIDLEKMGTIKIEFEQKIVPLRDSSISLGKQLNMCEKVLSFIKEHQLSEDIDSIGFNKVLIGEIQKNTQRVSSLNLNLTQLNQDFEQVKSKFSPGQLVTPIEVLNSEKKKLEHDVMSLNKELTEFIQLLQRLNIKAPLNNDEWSTFMLAVEQKLRDLELNIKVKNEKINELSLLKKLSEQVKGFKSTVELKSRHDKVELQFDMTKTLIDTLEKDVAELGDYIQQSIDAFFNTELINKLYQAIDPHPEFKYVSFKCTMGDKPKLIISAVDPVMSSETSPNLTFSSAQINVLALSIFLARALNLKDDDGEPVDCIFIDDPVQSIDAINTLSLIDVFRAICIQFKKQLIITTHDENFHELLKKKIPATLFPAKYLRLESFGKVAEDVN